MNKNKRREAIVGLVKLSNPQWVLIQTLSAKKYTNNNKGTK